MKIQTIDLNQLRTSNDPKFLVQSFRDTGFAIIKNHDIPLELLNKTYLKWSEFFAMSTEEKRKYQFTADAQKGYYPFKSENAKDYPAKDLKEFYHFYLNDISAPELPDSLMDERNAMGSSTARLFFLLEQLGYELLHYIDIGSPTNIQNDFSTDLEKMAYESKNTLLRILHYPPLTAGEDPKAVRAAAHEDINLITLLPAATAPGLEVMDLDGNWHKVEADPGSIVINIGDMLEEASEGYYKSTTHRVVNPDGANTSRYSMPLFMHPHGSIRLSSRYTASEYLDERLRELGLK